jgi:hypothetical protein
MASQVMAMLEEINRSGTTIVMVTHDRTRPRAPTATSTSSTAAPAICRWARRPRSCCMPTRCGREHYGRPRVFNYYLRLVPASMRRTPVLTALMVLALGPGIGAFMTTFTVYYLMSGDPIPHKSDVLFAVQLDNWDPNSPPTESAKDVQPQISWQDGQNLLNADTPALRQVHMYAAAPSSCRRAKSRRSMRPSATTHQFFAMFDVPFLYGGP